MPRLKRRLSKSIAKKILLAENRCFQNSYWALRHLPNHAVLVIGFGQLYGKTLRHSWVEMDGSIIDPSWIGLLEKGDRPKYQSVHRYTKAQVRKLDIFILGRVHREALFSEWYDLGNNERALKMMGQEVIPTSEPDCPAKGDDR